MTFLTNVTLIIVLIVLLTAQRVFLSLAVYFDCQSKNVSSYVLWTVLTAVFGWIPAVVYACLRKTLKKKELLCRACGSRIVSEDGRCPRCGNDIAAAKNRQYGKTSITFIILFVVFYILSCVTLGVFYSNYFKEYKNVDILSSFEESTDSADESISDGEEGEIYYDRNGSSYTDIDDVVYYDPEGNSYSFDEDSFCYIDSQGNSYSSIQCFIDSDGYFYYDTDSELEYNSQLEKYSDKDGKTYIPIMGVYWDANGNLLTIY